MADNDQPSQMLQDAISAADEQRRNSLRLLSQSWKTVDQFAQVLYQVMSGKPGGALWAKADREIAERKKQAEHTAITQSVTGREEDARRWYEAVGDSAPIRLQHRGPSEAYSPPEAPSQPDTARVRTVQMSPAPAQAQLPAPTQAMQLTAPTPYPVQRAGQPSAAPSPGVSQTQSYTTPSVPVPQLSPPPAPPPPTPPPPAPFTAPATVTGGSASEPMSPPAPVPMPALAAVAPTVPTKQRFGLDWNPGALSMELPVSWNNNMGVPSGGGNSLSGMVAASVTGQYLQVTLYPDGYLFGDPGDVVTVYILQLDPTETVPPGTWITGINQYSDGDGNPIFEAQLPVWLA